MESVDPARRKLNASPSEQAGCESHVSQVGICTPSEADDYLAISARQLYRIAAKVAPELIDFSHWSEKVDLATTVRCPEIGNVKLRTLLNFLHQLFELVHEHPYCVLLYTSIARIHLLLGYPDLAAGAAYKALLLCDAVQDDADEYHEKAYEALRAVLERERPEQRVAVLKHAFEWSEQQLQDAQPVRPGVTGPPATDEEVQTWLRDHYQRLTYILLTQSLFLCGCYKTAGTYSTRAHLLYPGHRELELIRYRINEAIGTYFGRGHDSLPAISEWPDTGYARRECYQWNELEPDRLRDLTTLNTMMHAVAPRLKVRVVDLPALSADGSPSTDEVVKQLGVFAKECIAPGDVILDETSMLTANNKLQDALCDACSADLPDLHGADVRSTVSCPECQATFCSRSCFDRAAKSYHPALCDRDVEAIAKDVPPAQAADSLYALLLLRSLAMAQTQGCHPLELKEVKYIWGGFDKPALDKWSDSSSQQHKRSLPFSFEHNIRLPFHMLEKMDIDIFANPQYDVWVFNTLYAKLRGTASARLSGLGGRAIRGPEVSAVHPMWCLANHSCDPNVSWEWGGNMKFCARQERVAWRGRKSSEVKSKAGIAKGEEILNHYCDVDLPVKERREWARGALGGDCPCARCSWEAEQEAPAHIDGT